MQPRLAELKWAAKMQDLALRPGNDGLETDADDELD
jgi:hypothetical protein